MIRYHGGPITPESAALAAWRGAHAMVSFANPNQDCLAFASAESVALDNGAWPIFSAGKGAIDREAYLAWVKIWYRHPAFDWCLIPDIVDGSEEQNSWLINDWPLESAISVPVWHMHESMDNLYDYFEALAYRLRKVRVCSGDWARIVGPSPTTEIGLTGVFLDPPYSVEDRDAVYNEDSRDVAIEVRNWALEHAHDPKLRIAVCGYASEHEEFFPPDWEAIAWKANGGYANQSDKTRGRVNATRETIWFSPNCLRTTLFTQEHYQPSFSEEKDSIDDPSDGILNP